MIFPARPLTALALLAACLALVPAPPAGAQEGRPKVIRFGTHVFRLLLHKKAGLKPLTAVSEVADNPKDTLLIVFGDLNVLELLDEAMQAPEGAGLQKFLDRGGAVLIATDRGNQSQANILWQRLQVRPAVGVVKNNNEDLAYGGKAYCPLVTVFPNPKHPLFQGVRKGLATNYPTYLNNRNPALAPLANFPPSAVWEPIGGRFRQEIQLQSPQPFAVGKDGPGGKVLVLGGHGVFMTEMLANEDNFTFARNCIDWLTQSAGGTRRTRALFVEDNKISKSFNVSYVQLPGPPIPSVEKLNRRLRQLEEENFFNRMLSKYVSTEKLVRWLIIALSALLVFYGLRRLRLARHRLEVTVPLVAEGVAQTVSNAPLVAQRERGMVREGNLWEAARDLARECFAGYVEASAAHPPPRPQVSVRGKWWGRGGLPQLVQKLWDLAYGGPAAPVSQAQFHRLIFEVDEVKSALASGHLSLQAPAPKPRIEDRGSRIEDRGSQTGS
jgi:hypothetical protein